MTLWEAQIDITRASFAGEPLAKATLDAAVPARRRLTLRLPEDVAAPAEPSSELVAAAGSDAYRALWFCAPDRELTLQVDRLDPAADTDDALAPPLPGESALSIVRTSQGVAGRLLGATDEPIKAIAVRLGYRDVFYFTRQFTLRTGVAGRLSAKSAMTSPRRATSTVAPRRSPGDA